MRAVVLVLAGLAGLKIWTHDQIFRSAAEEALVQAYRGPAVEACFKGTRRDSRPAAGPNPWAAPASVRLVMGRSDVDVAIWDVDNALWVMRYKYPLLVIDAGGAAAGLVCEYDVTLGTAAVTRGGRT